MFRKLLPLSLAACFATACGGTEVDPSSHEISTDDSALNTAWTPIHIFESAHPYSHNYRQSFTVHGSANATQLKIVYERFETEEGYDFLDLSGGSLVETISGNNNGRSMVIEGSEATFTFRTDAFVNAWGYRILVYERTACAVPAVYAPVCGVDGNTYGNHYEAACINVAIAHQGECAVWATTAELKARPSDFADKRVRVRATATLGRQIYLPVACRSNDGCCGGSVALFTLDGIALDDFNNVEEYKCTTNGCGVSTCTPWGTTGPVTRTFEGMFRTQSGYNSLEVISRQF